MRKDGPPLVMPAYRDVMLRRGPTVAMAGKRLRAPGVNRKPRVLS